MNIDALIERLRIRANQVPYLVHSGSDYKEVLEEAADALAKLRDKNNLNCQSAVNYGNKLSDAQAEIAKLKHDLERYIDIANEHVNENEKLREALEKITKTYCRDIAVIEIARAALGEKE